MPDPELTPVLAIWSSTDPGAIGAGNIWWDIGSDAAPDAPRLRLRNRRDTGWVEYVMVRNKVAA